MSNRIKANERDRGLMGSKISDIDNRLIKFNWDNAQAKQKTLSIINKLQVELAKIKLDHEQEIEKQQHLVVMLKLKANSLQETYPVFGQALQSLEPVGKNKRIILSVFIVLGIFMAIFAALIIEFAHKVQDRKNSHEQV